MSVRKEPAKKAAAKRPREKKVNPNEQLTLPTPWIGTEQIEEDHEGFVYLITCLKTKRKYIGRKYLKARTRVKVAGRTNRRRKVSESNWRHYKSSCDELKKDIAELGIDKFKFEIIWLCKSRRETNYKELEELVKRDVLTAKLKDGTDAYYNGNILSRYFKE